MSFFNPFRKNQRPEGVKLATMQTPEEAGTAAPHAEPTFGPRTEPSLGRFNEGTQTGRADGTVRSADGASAL